MASQVRVWVSLMLLLFFCSCCSVLPLCKANGVQYQTLRLIPVDEEELEEVKIASKKGESLWEVGILHRDSKSSPFRVAGRDGGQILSDRLKRDAARVEGIAARLEQLAAGSNLSAAAAFQTPVISGLSQGSGEYFAQLGVGTPARQTYLVVDTGSDLSWLQCLPCGSCYQQTGAVFNPAASKSYKKVTCSSPQCSKLDVRGCQGTDCLYQVAYGDGSFTVGNFATETMSFAGGVTVPNVAVGCGHQNEGLFVGAAGLLGLGGGPLSFPSQVNYLSRGQFSYCLADRETSGTSSLYFGPGAIPRSAAFTPLLKNPRTSTFYYVPLSGISVGGRLLPLPKTTFALGAGSGGVIIDSGTSVTRLVSSAYVATRDAFKAGARSLPPAPGFALFDTCYNLAGRQSVDVPTVDLLFQGGARMALPAKNYLIPVDNSGTYCFAFAATSGSLSIIGNLQQQGFRVSFDTRLSRVGIAANQC